MSYLFFLSVPFRFRGSGCSVITPLLNQFRYLFPLLPVVAFYFHFSFSPVFLRPLVTQQLFHLSCGLPRFLQPPRLLVSDLFGNPSSLILTVCPTHFIRLLTIPPTIQTLVPTFFLRSFYFSRCHAARHPRC